MSTSSYTVGFVYVLINEAMPGIVKIGWTSKMPEDRAKELYKTGVPMPYMVAYRTTTSRPQIVEERVHALLERQRFNSQREFFRIGIDEAVDAVRQALIDMASIESWYLPKPHLLVSGDRVSLTLKRGQIFALISYKDLARLAASKADIADLWQAHSDGDLLEIYATDSASYVSGSSGIDFGSNTDPVPYLDRQEKVVNGLINGREILVPGERLVWIPALEDEKDKKSVVFESRGYCQIVCRTWSPIFNSHGFPLLLNDFTLVNLDPSATEAVNAARSLPIPRTWAPRQERDDSWAPIGIAPQRPEYWLPQLKRQYRKR